MIGCAVLIVGIILLGIGGVMTKGEIERAGYTTEDMANGLVPANGTVVSQSTSGIAMLGWVGIAVGIVMLIINAVS